MPLLKDYIYLAGILDGEGCFNLGHCRNSFVPRILVVNTNENLVNWLKDNFGGDIVRTTVKNKPNWKPRFTWRLSNRKALDLAYEVVDYLIVKRDQAMAFCTWRATQDVIKKNERKEGYKYLAEQLTIFNRKGINYAIV